MTTLLKSDFETKLGIICTYVESNFSTAISYEENHISTEGYSIHLQSFEIKDKLLGDTLEIESSQVWRWYIEKINEVDENLIIHCELINPDSSTSFGGESGQYLDAVGIVNRTERINIGTEDGEIMQARARKSDWMPKRFSEILSTSYSFTEYADFGFKTAVPRLNLGEKIYFHFLVATNTIKNSKEYPDEVDMSTWFAVDQHKHGLDKFL